MEEVQKFEGVMAEREEELKSKEEEYEELIKGKADVER